MRHKKILLFGFSIFALSGCNFSKISSFFSSLFKNQGHPTNEQEAKIKPDSEDGGELIPVTEEGVYYFEGSSVDELNEVSLKEDCKKIVFSENTVLSVDKTIRIRDNQTVIGNNALIKRNSDFYGKLIILYENVSFSNFTIDGSNITDGTWDNTIDLATTSGCHVFDCNFINSNEALVAYGRDVVIENNNISNSSGNGIHLSDSYKAIVRRNSITNSNLSEYYTNGKCGIYICQDVYDALIEGNTIVNALNGIGRLDSIKDQNITILNNHVKDCREYALYGIYHATDENDTSKDVGILNNIFENSGSVMFQNNTDNSVKSDSNLKISGNKFIRTNLNIASNKNALVENNIFQDCYISLNYCVSISCIGNTINGKDMGIYGQRSQDITVKENKVTASKYGICFKTESGDNTIIDNSIEVNSLKDEIIEAVSVGQRSIIKGNQIRINKSTGIICYDYSLVELNTIICTLDDTIAIRVYGGSKNITVKDNITNKNGLFSLSNGEDCVYENNIIDTELVD